MNMYIQITTKCNMTCEHCCFSCTMDGEHMSMSVWKRVLELVRDDAVSIGGGEPTLHPKFKTMMFDLLGNAQEFIWISTNGSNKKASLALAAMASANIIQAQLSYDAFHDSHIVDDEVYMAFKRLKAIRTQRKLIDHGRAHDNKDSLIRRGWKFVEDCACDDFFIKPNGNIHQCGCHGSPIIGDVWSGFKAETSGCWRQLEKERRAC